MKLLEYKAPLVVLSAGVLSIGLLCSVSVIALWESQRTVSVTEPLNLIDAAIDHLATTAAVRKQGSDFLSASTSTALPTLTAIIATPTSVPSNTPIVESSLMFMSSRNVSKAQPIIIKTSDNPRTSLTSIESTALTFEFPTELDSTP